MTRFAYDDQLASMPAVVVDILGRADWPRLDAARPIIFAGIGTSLHAANLAAVWVKRITDGKVRAFGLDAHDLGAGAIPLRVEDQVVVISHRGKKVFPNASLKRAKALGCFTISIVGQAAPEQEADVAIRTCANETTGTFSVSYLTSLAALLKIILASFPNQAKAVNPSLAKLPEAIAASLKLKRMPGPLAILSLITIDIFRNLPQKALAFLEPPSERLDEALVTLAAFGLRCGLRVVRQGRCDGQPEADEEGERLGGDAEIALEALDLARQAVEAAREGRLALIRPVGRQEGCHRCLDDRGTGQLFAVSEIGDLAQHLGREIDIHPVAHGCLTNRCRHWDRAPPVAPRRASAGAGPGAGARRLPARRRA
jgi:hypothetical protein